MVKPDRPQTRRFHPPADTFARRDRTARRHPSGRPAAIWDRRAEAIARSEQETTNLGVVLAEQTARSIQAVDLVLQEVQAMVAAAGVDSPMQFEPRWDRRDPSVSGRPAEVLPQADAIGLVGENGKLVNGSRSWPAPAVDLSDRDYLHALAPIP